MLYMSTKKNILKPFININVYMSKNLIRYSSGANR